MTAPLDPFELPLSGSRLIEASAGTGKTWTIAALYLRLVLGHGDERSSFGRALSPSQILVMTFTVAATRELSARIRERLVTAAACFRDAIVPADDRFLAALVAAYPAGPAREHAAWRLATAAEAMDDAAVVTIDAWVQRVLREHAFDSGSVFDEVLEPDQEAMLAEATRDYWRQEIYPLHGPSLDDALGIWPSFTAFAAEMRWLVPRIAAGDDDPRSLAQAQSEAGVARRLLLERWKHGWPERLEAMRAWLETQLGQKHVKVFDTLRPKTVAGWMAKLIEWADDIDRVELGVTDIALERLSPGGLLACAKDPKLVLPPEFEAFAHIVRPDGLDAAAAAMQLHAAGRIKARVRMLKERAGIFGFQDQLERLDRALRGSGGDRLRERIVEQFPVALVDEFQDTSPLQYGIFDRLYRTATDDRSTALLLIGDPKQSIFGFRDADIHSYLRARTATDGRHHVLTTNHRSTAPLVDAINRLFGEAEALPDGAFRFGGGPDRPLPFVPVAARGRDARFVAGDRAVAALTIAHDAELTAQGEALQRFAERCAEDIAKRLDDPAVGFVDGAGCFVRLRPADIAVLVRNRIEAAAMRRALARRRIVSVFLSDQDSVFASDEASDLLHWLRAVADPLDHRRARIGFATRFADLTVAEMARLVTDEEAFEARVEQLRRLNVEWREQGVLAMLRRSLHVLDLPARWLARGDNDGRGERRLTNVLHLAELLQQESARLDGEQAMIRWLGERLVDGRKRSDEEIVRLESDADLLRIVTIHKAKGLEYPVVYLPFACSTRMPSNGIAWLPDADGIRRLHFGGGPDIRGRVELEARREELRLLYVALTRAQHALWIGVTAPMAHKRSAFHRSALGYLLTGDRAIDAAQIASVLHDRFEGLAAVELVADDGTTRVTRPVRDDAVPPLHDAPVYDATFERDWSIGSFSALIRDLARVRRMPASIDPSVEEEVLSGPMEEALVVVPSSTARHRFPRGAFAGSFLHDQLEWLSQVRFALDDADVRNQLAARCRQRGWGQRADDVVEWLGEVASTVLPPIGVALGGLTRILPEMEFWLPNEHLDAAEVDRLCDRHLLGGRERPPLPARALRGMLMGFMDLVFEVDGRYWVLDYKSNALGLDDGDYSADAIAQAMAVHRYDVQGAIYLFALHRLLQQRIGESYDPAKQLGGALYLFIRGIEGPEAGCHVLAPDPALLDGFATMLDREEVANR